MRARESHIPWWKNDQEGCVKEPKDLVSPCLLDTCFWGQMLGHKVWWRHLTWVGWRCSVILFVSSYCNQGSSPSPKVRTWWGVHVLTSQFVPMNQLHVLCFACWCPVAPMARSDCYVWLVCAILQNGCVSWPRILIYVRWKCPVWPLAGP